MSHDFVVHEDSDGKENDTHRATGGSAHTAHRRGGRYALPDNFAMLTRPPHESAALQRILQRELLLYMSSSSSSATPCGPTRPSASSSFSSSSLPAAVPTRSATSLPHAHETPQQTERWSSDKVAALDTCTGVLRMQHARHARKLHEVVAAYTESLHRSDDGVPRPRRNKNSRSECDDDGDGETGVHHTPPTTCSLPLPMTREDFVSALTQVITAHNDSLRRRCFQRAQSHASACQTSAPSAHTTKSTDSTSTNKGSGHTQSTTSTEASAKTTKDMVQEEEAHSMTQPQQPRQQQNDDELGQDDVPHRSALHDDATHKGSSSEGFTPSRRRQHRRRCCESVMSNDTRWSRLRRLLRLSRRCWHDLLTCSLTETSVAALPAVDALYTCMMDCLNSQETAKQAMHRAWWGRRATGVSAESAGTAKGRRRHHDSGKLVTSDKKKHKARRTKSVAERKDGTVVDKEEITQGENSETSRPCAASENESVTAHSSRYTAALPVYGFLSVFNPPVYRCLSQGRVAGLPSYAQLMRRVHAFTERANTAVPTQTHVHDDEDEDEGVDDDVCANDADTKVSCAYNQPSHTAHMTSRNTHIRASTRSKALCTHHTQPSPYSPYTSLYQPHTSHHNAHPSSSDRAVSEAVVHAAVTSAPPNNNSSNRRLRALEEQLDTLLRQGPTRACLQALLRSQVQPSLRRIVYGWALGLPVHLVVDGAASLSTLPLSASSLNVSNSALHACQTNTMQNTRNAKHGLDATVVLNAARQPPGCYSALYAHSRFSYVPNMQQQQQQQQQPSQQQSAHDKMPYSQASEALRANQPGLTLLSYLSVASSTASRQIAHTTHRLDAAPTEPTVCAGVRRRMLRLRSGESMEPASTNNAAAHTRRVCAWRTHSARAMTDVTRYCGNSAHYFIFEKELMQLAATLVAEERIMSMGEDCERRLPRTEVQGGCVTAGTSVKLCDTTHVKEAAAHTNAAKDNDVCNDAKKKKKAINSNNNNHHNHSDTTIPSGNDDNNNNNIDNDDKKDEDEEESLCNEPFIPLQGFSLWLAPLCYVTGNVAEQYTLLREMTRQLWGRLHRGPQPELLQCCWLFEKVVVRHVPQLYLHLHHVLHMSLMRHALHWMLTSFAELLPPSEVLVLWDCMLYFHVERCEAASERTGSSALRTETWALWVLPLLAASVVVFRAPLMARCQTAEEAVHVLQQPLEVGVRALLRCIPSA